MFKHLVLYVYQGKQSCVRNLYYKGCAKTHNITCKPATKKNVLDYCKECYSSKITYIFS